jgi:uncharacterized protein YndB with AHSA1/START domain
MSIPASIAPVHTSVTVDVSREHAFTVFTQRFDAWWPRSHHIGDVPLDQVRLEPRAGGRWYEVRTDGSESEWGKVLTWDPPGRLVLAWQLNATFTYDPDFLTEVEVTFTEVGPSRTQVVLEHRNLESYGERSEELRDSLGGRGGWPSLLGEFVSLTRES